MCNFRETKDLEHDCTSCVSFTSYAEMYDDEEEASDMGKCEKGVDNAESEMVCDLYNSRLSTDV